MRPRKKWSLLLALTYIIVLPGCGPSRFPKDVAAAWKAAGAEVGTMKADRPHLHDSVQFFDEKQRGAGNLPAFKIRSWQSEKLDDLPMPNIPFGLDLSFSKITQEDALKLRRFKHLRLLDLTGTPVLSAEIQPLRDSFPELIAEADFHPDPPRPVMPEEVKQLGERVGAYVGWFHQWSGIDEFVDEGSEGDVPTLCFTSVWKPGALKQMHEVQLGFGIDLAHTEADDTALEDLAGHPTLKALDLNGTKVTNDGMDAVATLITLESLTLRNTIVSNEGLKKLHSLKNLKMLSLEGAPISEDGIAKFKLAVPACEIFH